ncbi:MAG TPA: alpha/beta hydrolase [Chloroflexia bacterium]|nr:alpha/beta hydrolase [Chloroflexia bacterium]
MTLNLWPDRELETEGANAGCPSLTPYLLDEAGPHPAIMVIPGGGYMRRADHEGEPIARWLNSIGVAAFVLNYRVAPFGYPAQLQDAQRAIRLVRYHAQEWRVDPQRLGVLGFSAGGHVASTAGTHYTAGEPQATDPVERLSSRPDLMVLCYPVITMGAHAHQGSRAALLGERESDEEMVALLSSEQQVNEDTPPTFLWHTAQDASVPVENSLHFAAALARHGVRFELHIYEQGSHGLGLAQSYPGAGTWTALCATWLEQGGFITGSERV